MIASVSVADVGVANAARLCVGPQTDAPGLLDIHTGQTARLRRSIMPDIAYGRIATIGFWETDDAFDRFLEARSGNRRADTLAAALRDGWTAKLRPLRAYGGWPGLPSDTPTSRDVDNAGPVIVLTIGQLRVRRSVPWLRASARAQGELADAEGLIWAMGMSRPPRFVATMSVWESAEASKAYAFRSTGAHHQAIEANRATPFMHEEAFIRFQPFASSGQLDGCEPVIANGLFQ
jgi:heme-degrading monooxygenase HmoA